MATHAAASHPVSSDRSMQRLARACWEAQLPAWPNPDPVTGRPPTAVDPDALRQRIAASPGRLVVLDDDPTGTQTVHGVDVLTRWTVEDLSAALADSPGKTFYVLTNSRALSEADAVALNREIARNLAHAARRTGIGPITVVSRSDSTLRGHFPAETDALAAELAAVDARPFDGVVLVPFFEEGGRFTAWDVHWVQQGDEMVPAGQTEFARDHAFGYQASNLRAWVEEKTAGRVPASRVASITLEQIRRGGPDEVARLLQQASAPVYVVNATSYADLEVAVSGLLQAEAAGRRFLFRTAASFVRVRGGIPPRGLLRPPELQPMTGPGVAPPAPGGLVVVGSYVRRTSQQLERLLALSGLVPVELRVPAVLAGGEAFRRAVRETASAVEAALREGHDAVVYTTRELLTRPGAEGLQLGAAVSAALVEAVRQVPITPAWVVAKGGITSSDVATRGLGVGRARVQGQILPGVPVWRLGPETRFPGLTYVVFPGNVGGPEALAEVVRTLRAGARASAGPS